MNSATGGDGAMKTGGGQNESNHNSRKRNESVQFQGPVVVGVVEADRVGTRARNSAVDSGWWIEKDPHEPKSGLCWPDGQLAHPVRKERGQGWGTPADRGKLTPPFPKRRERKGHPQCRGVENRRLLVRCRGFRSRRNRAQAGSFVRNIWQRALQRKRQHVIHGFDEAQLHGCTQVLRNLGQVLLVIGGEGG